MSLGNARAQTDFEKEPINYYTASVDDAMHRLKVGSVRLPLR